MCHTMSSTQNAYLARRPLVLGLSKVLFLALGQIDVVRAIPVHISSYLHALEEPEPKPADDPSLWMYLAVAAALVLLGGAFAGLTIALMGQDEIYLQVIQDSGEGSEKRNAGKVLGLLKRGKHWVLVTLLLSNVITNETLPIVLDRSLGGGWPAVLGSTVLIVIFGEIVPQSVCVRYGLPIGAWMSPFVLALMYIMSPVAWPTAKLLDWLLGEDHGTIYKKAGLKTLVSLHRSMGESGQRLHADEVTIISAVLDLKEKSVGSIMTPMDDVFTLSLDDVLDEATMDDILSQGYSRIPVHHPDNDENFVGMLLVKMLITYDPEDAKPVREFALATLPETRPNTSCLDIVNFFQEGKSHMVLVSNHPGEDHGAIGVVTLEDVIEELIGEEIIDESDVFVDVHKAIRRMTPAPRTRVLKGVGIGEVKPTKAATDLVGISENQTLEASDLHRLSTTEEDTTKTQAVARRMSGNSVVVDGKTKHRASVEDVKGHLMHLGPSNLASRPKNTRYSSVKIKPGADSTTSAPQQGTANGRTTPQRRASEAHSEYSTGIGEGLLRSGGRDASDGVKALRQDYGSMSQPPSDRRPTSASNAAQANGALLDESAAKEPESTLRPQARENDSHDTVSPLPNRQRSKSPFYHRGPARSGSITENIVDTNGIRKVVLETTSSSDSNDEEEISGASKSHRPSLNKDLRNSSTLPQSTSNKLGGNEESHDASGSKKRRRRKKKTGYEKNAETEPLLGEQK